MSDGPHDRQVVRRHHQAEVADRVAGHHREQDPALVLAPARCRRQPQRQRDARRRRRSRPGSRPRWGSSPRRATAGRTSRRSCTPASTAARRTAPSPTRAACGPRRGAGPSWGSAGQPAVVAGQPDPGHRRQHGWHRPGARARSRQPPPAVRDRHGQHQRSGQPDRHRPRVERGDRADPVGEVQLDQRGEQHVRDRHPGQRRASRGRGTAAARGTSGRVARPMSERRQRQEGRPVHPDPAGQQGSRRAEARECEHRERGEQADRGARHRQPVADLCQHRSDGDRGRAQVEGEQDDPGQHEGGRDRPFTRSRVMARAGYGHAAHRATTSVGRDSPRGTPSPPRPASPTPRAPPAR